MIKNVLEVDNLTIQYNNTDAPVIKNLSFIIILFLQGKM